MNYLLVGMGGALGAMARFGLGSAINRLWAHPFPLATLIINIVGSVMMGLVVGAMAKLTPALGETVRLFIAVGLLGGFTTFSAFSLDTVLLIERGELVLAMAYVLLSVVVCVIGLYCGLLVIRGLA
ncbi:MAG: crcB [Devosia sp.]|nr:crcB [Devosia sp.]